MLDWKFLLQTENSVVSHRSKVLAMIKAPFQQDPQSWQTDDSGLPRPHIFMCTRSSSHFFLQICQGELLLCVKFVLETRLLWDWLHLILLHSLFSALLFETFSLGCGLADCVFYFSLFFTGLGLVMCQDSRWKLCIYNELSIIYWPSPALVSRIMACGDIRNWAQ